MQGECVWNGLRLSYDVDFGEPGCGMDPPRGGHTHWEFKEIESRADLEVFFEGEELSYDTTPEHVCELFGHRIEDDVVLAARKAATWTPFR